MSFFKKLFGSDSDSEESSPIDAASTRWRYLVPPSSSDGSPRDDPDARMLRSLWREYETLTQQGGLPEVPAHFSAWFEQCTGAPRENNRDGGMPRLDYLNLRG